MKARGWYWLLLLPLVATLVPPFYARAAPAVAGFPFFYWYQIVWIVLAAAITWLVYLQVREAGS